MNKSAVGSLLHLYNRTRPDIAYAVGLVSRFSSDPCKEHWMAVKRIFRYLKSTTNYGLLYKAEGSTDCVGFSDADWAGDLSDRKSTSGFVFLVQKVQFYGEARNNHVLHCQLQKLNMLLCHWLLRNQHG